MNIYKSLNDITLYIDKHLEEKIDYEVLAKKLGVNAYTMHRLFNMIAGISLSEYIRKRRLSNAGYDLYKGNIKIIDVAIKYNYDNATSFSRAFEKFHGVKPSSITKETKLKIFPRIVFNEDIYQTTEFDYEIVNLDEMNLYGVGISTNNIDISHDAPLFFRETENKYINRLGKVVYGMISYDLERTESQKYYCLYTKKIDEFQHFYFPKGKWLKFRINSQNASEIQDISHKFYEEFLPSVKYNLKELPELEYYHDDVTDFLVAIY